jgi:DNA-binding NarL/FixJ family response regulator
MNSTPIRLILADDHLLMREGLKRLLASQPDLHVVAETADPSEAIQLLAHHKPHILLLNLELPPLAQCQELLRRFQHNLETRVIVFSMEMDSSQSHAIRALQSGASGFLGSDCSSGEMFEAIRTVAGGGEYIARSLRKKLSPPC